MDKPRGPAGSQALFLVWAAPDQGSPRSRLLARELGIPEPYYLAPSSQRGVWTAPLRYFIQGMRTLRLLFQKRPRVVLVQSPPSYAVWFAALYCALTGSRYIVDAHSDALQRKVWTWPGWLYRRLAQGALVTLVTDEHYRRLIESWGGKAQVLRDPVTTYPLTDYPLNGHFTVTMVNTFAGDEPLEEVLHAAAELPEISFYVTGKVKRADPQMVSSAAKNVHFTDFLPEAQYYGLLKASHAVMSLTTRDHTLQCGACEALSLARPIITSDWPLLREYFSQGTVHVDNSREGIRQGIETLRGDYQRYAEEVERLHRERRQTWERQTAELAGLIGENAH